MNGSLTTSPDVTRTTPFLKWAGGKSALLPQLARHFPPRAQYRRYFEPFLGGGAVFFSLLPERSHLFDINADLIELYQIVRDQVDALIEALAVHRNEEGYFYEVRGWDPATLTPVERAARILFLNRTCYNGLYRVNRRGQFNVPFGGYKNPTICDAAGLRRASRALQGAHLAVRDFEQAPAGAGDGDFVYLDPPYEPLTVTSSFTSYTRGGFGSDDQRRLAALVRELTARGALVALSNSAAPLIRELYRELPIHEISARRAINSKGNGRGAITELLITSYTPASVDDCKARGRRRYAFAAPLN